MLYIEVKALDKYEYNLKLDQMKSLFAEENYEAAAEIADSINWNKAKNVNALFRAGEIYEKVGRYQDAKEVFLLAYDRSPIGRMIIYRLAEVAIKMKDFMAANEYYREFVEIAPRDNLKYVLRYNIKKAQGAGYHELIPILEELKEQECTEEWAYELAYLYHKAGKSDKCIDACDELILWFGDGPYVERALELKMLYQPLSKQQEEKYRSFRQEKAGITNFVSEDMEQAGEFGHGNVNIPQVKATTEKFNTMNLQAEIARGMQQILEATEKETVSDTMETIKKMVEEIPYLQLPREEEKEDELETHIETDEEIDGSLKINFQELIGEEGDGQMSLVVQDNVVEKQITGQMSIEDVLEEWEKTKHAAEIAMEEAKQRKLESAKARALQEAGDLMDRLQDVIPKLEAGVTPVELLENEYLQNMPKQDCPIIKASETARMPQITEMIPEQFEEEVTAEEPQNPSPVMENTQDLLLRQEREARSFFDDMNSMLGDHINKLSADNAEIDQMIQAGTAAAGLVGGVTELFSPEAEPKAPQVVSEIKASVISEPEPYMTIAGEPHKTGSIVVTDDDIEKAQDLGKTRKMPTIGEIQKEQWLQSETTRMPVDAIKKELKTGEDQIENLNDVDEPQAPEKEVKEEKGMSELSKELRSVFSYFVPVKGMEDQLCQALSGIINHLKNDESASRGNLIIQGGKACGKTVLATSVIKALQKETGKPAGKVGKINAEALNQKDIQQLLRKVAGGCLIIEGASAISRETAVTLSLLLEHDQSGLLIILEDTSIGIKKALSQDDGFAKKFTEKITVPTFSNDELVVFAKSYARELGYEIDEMAVLALYNRISNIQRLDQATTLTEVKEIVDGAIDASERGGIKRAFSMLTSKRYSEDNKIILRERDFEE